MHPFRITNAHYIYVLTQLTKNKMVIEAICYTKAKATTKFEKIECNDNYKDCFNFFLTKNRKLEIWSNNHKIKSVSHLIKKCSEIEPHKHPINFSNEILKGEEFGGFIKQHIS